MCCGVKAYVSKNSVGAPASGWPCSAFHTGAINNDVELHLMSIVEPFYDRLINKDGKLHHFMLCSSFIMFG